jgi:hypothetical protein
VPGFGGRQVSRISAALEVTNDLVDHYASLAFYLRLNGLLPPTAQRKDECRRSNTFHASQLVILPASFFPERSPRVDAAAKSAW